MLNAQASCLCSLEQGAESMPDVVQDSKAGLQHARCLLEPEPATTAAGEAGFLLASGTGRSVAGKAMVSAHGLSQAVPRLLRSENEVPTLTGSACGMMQILQLTILQCMSTMLTYAAPAGLSILHVRAHLIRAISGCRTSHTGVCGHAGCSQHSASTANYGGFAQHTRTLAKAQQLSAWGDL